MTEEDIILPRTKLGCLTELIATHLNNELGEGRRADRPNNDFGHGVAHVPLSVNGAGDARNSSEGLEYACACCWGKECFNVLAALPYGKVGDARRTRRGQNLGYVVNIGQ